MDGKSEKNTNEEKKCNKKIKKITKLGREREKKKIRERGENK